MKAIIGKKVGMSQIFDENGRVIPVTVIEAGPCAVVQKKTSEKEGYNAVQLGFEDIAERKLTKGEMGGSCRQSNACEPNAPYLSRPITFKEEIHNEGNHRQKSGHVPDF